MRMESIKRIVRKIVYSNKIQVFWSKTSNWGDALNPILVECLSNKKARFAGGPTRNKYMVIGSILQRADTRTEVWGSGFISSDSSVLGHPRQVHAVRGPFSRQRLLALGIQAPKVYGDAALLLPYFYQSDVEKTFDLGIVPHYTDKGHPWLASVVNDDKINIIDVEGGIYKFVDEVNACERVVSSSLHGIICADAYGIPSGWIKLGDSLEGDDFKFHDYYASVGRGTPVPLAIDSETMPEDLYNHAAMSPMNIDLAGLINACPFVADDVRKKILKKVNAAA